jgi:hypothetical protein
VKSILINATVTVLLDHLDLLLQNSTDKILVYFWYPWLRYAVENQYLPAFRALSVESATPRRAVDHANRVFEIIMGRVSFDWGPDCERRRQRQYACCPAAIMQMANAHL